MIFHGEHVVRVALRRMGFADEHRAHQFVVAGAELRRARLQSDLGGQLEPFECPRELWRVERLLLIVIENAVKYTPSGGKIEMRLSNGRGNARIEIRDNGIGISDKDLPHIFERFYRADQARSRVGRKAIAADFAPAR